jgi:hypothetical protein
MPTVKGPPELSNNTLPLSGSWTTLASAADWQSNPNAKNNAARNLARIFNSYKTIDSNSPVIKPRQISISGAD